MNNKAIKTAIAISIPIVLFYGYRKRVGGRAVPANLYYSKDKPVRLYGETVVITGANTGIGLETAKKMAELGARVIIATRSEIKAREAISTLPHKENVEFMYLDLSSLQSVKQFAVEFQQKKIQCNYLINNAGIFCAPHNLTKDGFEVQFQVNHLGHFLLVSLLMDNLIKNNARIINVSSTASEKGKINFDSFKTDGKPATVMELYRQSKLCNMLFSKELARRYPNKIISYSVDPGLVNTDIARNISYQKLVNISMWLFAKTPSQGSQTSIFAALCDKNEIPNGSYLCNCAVKENNNPLTRDLALQKIVGNFRRVCIYL